MPNQNKTTSSFSPFTTNIILVVLVLIGLALIPQLTVKLNPGRSLPTLYLDYNYYNATPQIVEQQVTSKLEGLLSTVKGINKIISQSSSGWGQIELQLDKNADIQTTRFEVLGIIRQIYPKLPELVSYPRLSKGSRDESKQIRLLTYTLNSTDDSYKMLRYIQNSIQPHLASIKNLSNINIYGSTPYEWEVLIDKDKIEELNITSEDVTEAINLFSKSNDLGTTTTKTNSASSTETKFVRLYGHSQNSDELGEIPIKKVSNRIIILSDIAQIQYKQQAPKSFYRINGLTSLNILLYASADANQLNLAKEVFSVMDNISQNLPHGYCLTKSYDATEFLQKELHKTYARTLFAIVILLLFALLINRSFRYLLLIVISLFANLIIAAIFYYLFKIEIHLYSLAGITVSFGIIIDNTIIMIDHLRNKQNRHAFLAILAATLTTIGALTVIFFLNESQKIKLIDFAFVIIINLTVSLFIALFFIPALITKIPLKVKTGALIIRRKKKILRFNKHYKKTILFLSHYRWIMLFVLIFSFGLPIIFIPEKVEGKEWYHTAFSKTLGNDYYVREVKPIIDKFFGGSMRLFVNAVKDNNSFSKIEKTNLNINIKLQEGGTLSQLNNIVKQIENYLLNFTEIEQFYAQINNKNSASITIHFKPAHEFSSFPFILKSKLETKAVELTSADFTIYGVGRGFSNALYSGYKNSRLIFTGYNYQVLMQYANQAKDSLLKYSRIKEVSIQSGLSQWAIDQNAQFIDIDKSKLLEYNESFSDYSSSLQKESISNLNTMYIPYKNQIQQVSVRYKNSGDFWNVNNSALKTNGKSQLKLNDISNLTTQKTDNLIYKEDQQYLLTVAYDFIGPNKLAEKVLEEQELKINKYLPIGYRVYQDNGYGWWNKNDSKQYFLIFIMLAIIYVVCAILLESLIQPLAIIATIPISFIGVFLTFSLFGFQFDQGGYASFLLLSGLVVNSALYIINDLNILKRNKQNTPLIKLYIKAYNTKITPIALTILSTVLGLIPFIFFGEQEVFWFALAVGTTGGLIFSVIAVVFILPIMFKQQP